MRKFAASCDIKKEKLPVCEFLGLRSGMDKPTVLLGYDNAPLDK
jgi:hypothetical protein